MKESLDAETSIRSASSIFSAIFLSSRVIISGTFIAPVLQLSALKNEFPSEGLRVFYKKHPAGIQKCVPSSTNRENRIPNSTYALESFLFSEQELQRHIQRVLRI